MLKKLKNIFNQNECTRILDHAEIDSSQEPIDFTYMLQLKPHLFIESKRVLLFQQLTEGMMSKRWVKRLKYLITIHFLLTETSNQFLSQYIDNLKTKQQVNINKVEQLNLWMNSTIVDYYHNYILKLNKHIELYIQCHKCGAIKLQHLNDISLITNCFKILNIINNILQTQNPFNKIGRYYPKYLVVIDLYKMYLKDIKVFYNYLQSVTEAIYENYTKLPLENLRHSFIFVIEMQKINDQLYEFFHNRYYYKSARLISFPLFFTFDDKKYRQMVRYIKKVDSTIPIPTVKKNFNQTELNQTKLNETKVNINHKTMIYSIRNQENVEDRLNEMFPDLHNNCASIQ